ncbi:MAG: hypothetical protein ABJE66_28275 [Deltaproteobacteria bacterium]
MGEFASRGPSHTGPAYASPSQGSAQVYVKPETAADRASKAVSDVHRRTESLGKVFAELEAARSANDRPRWESARAAADHAIAAVEHGVASIVRADASDQDTTKLVADERALADRKTALAEMAAPRGYATVACEEELRLAVDRLQMAPDAERDAREAAVRAWVDALSLADAKVLQHRLARRAPYDELAVSIAALAPEERTRVISFQHATERRKAREAVAREPAIVPPRVESLDDRIEDALARTLDNGADQPVIDVIATLSDDQRATFARRFTTYRQGSGDGAAARFTRLDRPLREHLLALLRAPHVVAPTAHDEDARVARMNSEVVLHAQSSPETYLQLHRPAVLATLDARLAGMTFGTGDPRLTWADAASFRAAVLAALADRAPGDWPALLHPSDPWQLVDALRPGHATGWVPSIGAGLADELELALRRSLGRMSPRYVIEAGGGDRVTPDALIASHPMDRVAIAGLCAPHAVCVDHHAGSRVTTDVQARGVRLVSGLTWCGTTDRRLWNWVRVDEPTDVTAEEVALTLWDKPDFAYGLTVAAPYYGIPVEWARALPATRTLEPTWNGGGPESPLETLADSALADEVALAQSHHAPLADRTTALDAIASSRALLDELGGTLDPVALADELRRADDFVAAKQTWAATAKREELLQWSAVFAAQQATLATTCELVAGTLAAAGMTPDQLRDDRRHPAMRLLAELAEIAATSMFDRPAHAKLDAARAELRMLPVEAGTYASSHVDRDLAALRGEETVDPYTARGRTQALDAERGGLHRVEDALREQALAGGEPDPDALEIARVTRDWLALRVAVARLQHELGDLGHALEAADEGTLAHVANLFATDLRVLPSHLQALVRDLGTIDDVLASASTEATERQLGPSPESDGKAMARSFLLRQTRAEKTRIAGARFIKLVDGSYLKQIRNASLDALADARVRKVLVDIGVQIAIAVASSGLASVAGEVAAGVVTAAGGARTTEAAIGVATTARRLGAVTTFVVDAGANATGQTLVQGGSFGSTFADNLLTNAAVLAALRPLQALARQWTGLDQAAFAAWEQQGATWKLAAANAAALTGEAIAATAVGYATHRAIAAAKGEHVDDATLADWAAQGASIVIGHAVQARLGASMDRLRVAGRAAGDLIARVEKRLVLAAKLERTPTREAALDLLEQEVIGRQDEATFWKTLAEDPQRLAATGLSREQVEAHRSGVDADASALRGWGFVEVQLRLAGLEQEYAGGRLWAGDSEQIATTLAHAARMELAVAVEHHDTAAREWTVTLAGERIKIRERARTGRTRDAHDVVSVDTVTEAKRYAEAVTTLRPILEANVRTVVEASPDFATSVVHVGDSFGGIMHRDTRFEQGLSGDPHAQLVVFTHDGAMTNRGALASGQNPVDQTMPGVRSREHAVDQEAYNKSNALGDATMVGRFEGQTAAYRGEVVGLERRAQASAEAWAHPDKALRLRVRAKSGERWIYCDRFENAGGMGPPLWKPLAAITAGDLGELRAKGLVLSGDDPALSTKLHAGERVLVWGGSPTGAWASQDAARHGSTADLVGESPNVRRTPQTTASTVTAEEFAAQLREVIASGDDAAIEKLRDERITATHSGSLVPRNRVPGASYGRGAADAGIHVELGVPTKVELVDGGKLAVMIGVGEHPTTRIYDRLILALGQDPGSPGGPAGLLGKGAPNETAPVPPETVALRMILHDGRLTGLESEDGSVRLVGAAYATPKLGPWVIASERARFKELAGALSHAGDATHTGGRISADSHGVTTGIEVQRDRVPLANELVGARDYRLPATLSAERLALPAGDVASWPTQLEALFTTALRARAGRVEVYPESVREGMHSFRVYNGGQEVGLVRVYSDAAQAAREAEAAKAVTAAVPSLKEASERGVAQTEDGGAVSLVSHPRDANGMRGMTFEQLVENWQSAKDAEKIRAKGRIVAAVRTTARTLAELHARFRADTMMSVAQKEHEIASVVAASEQSNVRARLSSNELAELDARLSSLATTLREATIPLTRTLRSRANAFQYKDYAATGDRPAYGSVSVEDLGAAEASGSASADVATYLQSLRANSSLASMTHDLEQTFIDEYRDKHPDLLPDLRVVEWSELSSLVLDAAQSRPGTLALLKRQLGDVQ